MISGIRKEAIYHFLRGALCDDVAVTEVVDLDVLDVVAIGDVHLAVESRSRRGAVSAGRGGGRLRRRGCRGGLDRGHIDMLDALARLELSVDPSSGSSCQGVRCGEDKGGWSWDVVGVCVPAAAAASTAGFFGSAPPSPASGLRSRVSERRLGGERDRLSNRDFLGSGSVWSKRDRLVRRSESSMVAEVDALGEGRWARMLRAIGAMYSCARDWSSRRVVVVLRASSRVGVVAR